MKNLYLSLYIIAILSYSPESHATAEDHDHLTAVALDPVIAIDKLIQEMHELESEHQLLNCKKVTAGKIIIKYSLVLYLRESTLSKHHTQCNHMENIIDEIKDLPSGPKKNKRLATVFDIFSLLRCSEIT